MGIDCPMDASGDYFLQTNGEIPFSKGTAGTAYEAKKAKAWNVENILGADRLARQIKSSMFC